MQQNPIFSALIGANIFPAIAQLADRWASEVEGVSDPIIADIDEMRSKLAALFTVRHIVVHEIPGKQPYESGDIGSFITVSLQFVHAVDQYLDTMLNGNFPLQQQPMNAEAWRRAKEKDAELSALIELQGTLKSSALFRKAQESWTTFRQAQSEYVAGYDQEWPGTIAPLLQATEYLRMTVVRLDDIKRLVDETNWR